MRYEKNSPITSAETNDTIAPEINLTGMVVANPTVSCRIEGEDGALLFNPDTDNTLLINPIGLSVWAFLAQPHSVDDIVSYLTTLFSESPDHSVVMQDVEAFIGELAPEFISEVDADAAELHSG